MRLNWSILGTGLADSADGTVVELRGFPAPPALATHAAHFVLLPELPCCAGCVPADPLGAVEVFAAAPLPLHQGALRLQGVWGGTQGGSTSWRYRLREARPLDAPGWGGVTRRGVLAAGPLMCLAACAPGASDEPGAGRACWRTRRPSMRTRTPAASPACAGPRQMGRSRRSPNRCGRAAWRCCVWPRCRTAPRTR